MVYSVLDYSQLCRLNVPPHSSHSSYITLPVKSDNKYLNAILLLSISLTNASTEKKISMKLLLIYCFLSLYWTLGIYTAMVYTSPGTAVVCVGSNCKVMGISGMVATIKKCERLQSTTGSSDEEVLLITASTDNELQVMVTERDTKAVVGVPPPIGVTFVGRFQIVYGNVSMSYADTKGHGSFSQDGASVVKFQTLNLDLTIVDMASNFYIG